MEKALEKEKALQPYNKQGMDTITQHKQQIILAIIQDMIDTYGTAENALAAIGKMPVPNSQIRGAKFLKRALRILIRAEKGLEIHTKRGTTV